MFSTGFVTLVAYVFSIYIITQIVSLALKKYRTIFHALLSLSHFIGIFAFVALAGTSNVVRMKMEKTFNSLHLYPVDDPELFKVFSIGFLLLALLSFIKCVVHFARSVSGSLNTVPSRV